MIVAFVVLSGCGRHDTIYVDGTGSGSGSGVVQIDDRTFLPADFADQSVNHGVVDIAAVGDHRGLRFRLLGGTSDPGSFNLATAVGNRAILGIVKYDETLLKDLNLQVTTASETSSKLKVTLLIDLKCDASSGVRTIGSDEITTAATPHDSIWSVSGAAIKDSASNELVPSSTGSARSSLDSLLVEYPQACLRASVSDADNLPKNLKLGSLLLSIGESSSTDLQLLTVSSLKINGAVYNTWGLK